MDPSNYKKVKKRNPSRIGLMSTSAAFDRAKAKEASSSKETLETTTTLSSRTQKSITPPPQKADGPSETPADVVLATLSALKVQKRSTLTLSKRRTDAEKIVGKVNVKMVPIEQGGELEEHEEHRIVSEEALSEVEQEVSERTSEMEVSEKVLLVSDCSSVEMEDLEAEGHQRARVSLVILIRSEH